MEKEQRKKKAYLGHKQHIRMLLAQQMTSLELLSAPKICQVHEATHKLTFLCKKKVNQ